MNSRFAKAESLYQEWQAQLTEREEGIMGLLLRVGILSREETYETGNTKVFMRNVKSTIKKSQIKGPTLIFQPTLKEVLRTIKKLEDIGTMKLDQDGLPLWFYQNTKDIDKMMKG